MSETATKALERYFEVLRRSLPVFSVAEASLLCDVFNGTRFESYSVPLLWAEVSNAVQEGYAEKWEVDGPDLVERLRKLSYAESMALVDAIERYWIGPYRQDGPMEEKLREIGLGK